MTEKFCGLCKANGLKKQLILFQLNLEEAILLCENKECVYPLGATDNASLIVKRQASEVSNLRRKRKKKQKQGETEELVNAVPETRYLDSYLHWQNVDSLCWLHSVLSLAVHNVTLSTTALTLTKNADCLLRTLTEEFNKAQELFSTHREQAEKGLQDVRKGVWKYLQPRMKCKQGVNDSPVTALPLLLRENSILSEQMLQVYQWEFSCTACGYQQIDKRRKHLATFPNVEEGFSLQEPAFLRPCYQCGAPKQRSKLVYERMPRVVLLHFEQGLRLDSFQDLSFKGENDHYIMTQFIQYKQNPDHFIGWTREPKGKKWMEMDDLKSPVCCWSPCLPVISPSEVHIAVWEKASIVTAPPLNPATMKTTTTGVQEKPGENVKMECSAAKIPSRPLLSIDCNLSLTKPGDINRALLSPTLGSPLLPPVSVRSRSLSHGLPHKVGTGKFEPYIPRKKRLVSYSCPSSPICTKSDLDRRALALSSPMSPQPFLTWQEVKEQNKKINADDLQSDSGYSSPASVSSCGSLPVSQSSIVLDVHQDHEKRGVDEPIDVIEDSRTCHDAKLNGSSSYDMNNDLLQGAMKLEMSTHGPCHSIDLANKLEELLPDCLLENPHNFVHNSTAKDDRELNLTDFGKLSDEQDQFIRDLLAA